MLIGIRMSTKHSLELPHNHNPIAGLNQDQDQKSALQRAQIPGQKKGVEFSG